MIAASICTLDKCTYIYKTPPFEDPELLHAFSHVMVAAEHLGDTLVLAASARTCAGLYRDLAQIESQYDHL